MTVRIILHSTQRQTAASLLLAHDHPFYNFVLSFHQILFFHAGNLAEPSLFTGLYISHVTFGVT